MLGVLVYDGRIWMEDVVMFVESKRNLFTVPKDYYLAHCVASDLGMSAGIAVDMQKKFNLRGKILIGPDSLKHPTCVLTGRVFNLITKKRSYGKPTLESLTLALHAMKQIATDNGIKKIAMPRIGCGLDRLSWPVVREVIKLIKPADEILVCYL